MTTPNSKAARFLARCVALLAASIALDASAQGVDAPSQQPLRVQEIRCAGNDKTSCDFIREKLHLVAGDAVDEEEIRNAELRLASLRNFKSVHVRLEKGGQRGAVIIVLEVEEADPIATEFIGGISDRLTWKYGVLGARVAHQNLFGTGKYAELRAVALVPLQDDPNAESQEIALRYADPQLFDSRRWFAQANAGWFNRTSATEDGSFTRFRGVQLGGSVGWRFADFSYLTLGATWRPGAERVFGIWHGDGSFEVRDDSAGNEKLVDFTYGWNSEDDLLFPTRGSSLQLGLSHSVAAEEQLTYASIKFRKTWKGLGGYWSLAMGSDPTNEYREAFNENQTFSLTYGRPLEPGASILRGRWYIEPGFDIGLRTPEGETRYGLGIKVGLRTETRQLGVVNLYILATEDWTQ